MGANEKWQYVKRNSKSCLYLCDFLWSCLPTKKNSPFSNKIVQESEVGLKHSAEGEQQFRRMKALTPSD